MLVSDEELGSIRALAEKKRKTMSNLLREALKLPLAATRGRPKLFIPCCACRKPFPRSKVAAHERKCNG